MPASRQSQLERAAVVSRRNGAGHRSPAAADSLLSADLLNSVLAHAPIILWEIDVDGVFTLSTGRGLNVLATKPGDLLGRSAFDFYSERPAVLDEIQRALAGEEFCSVVDLEGVCLDCWYAPLRDADDVIIGVRRVATVVTQQKRAEQALRESEDRFSKAFYSSPVGILISRLDDGLFIDVNDAFVRMCGFSRDEIFGQTSLQLNMWGDSGERDRFVQTLRKHGTIRDEEFRFRSKDGKQIVGRVSAEMIELDGKPCVLTLCDDITEWKRAENAVRDSQQLYRTLSRLAPVGIFHTDANGHFLGVNEQYTSVTGLTLADVVVDGFEKALHPDDRSWVIAEWKSAVAAGRPIRCECRFQRPDGVTTWVLAQAVPERNDAGEVTSYVGTITGIDDFKQIEHAQRNLNLELTSRIRERTNELSRVDLTLQEQIEKREQLFADLLESQARWKSVVEDAPDYILLVDRQGTIAYINRTPPPLKRSDVEGMTVFDLVPSEYHDRIQETIALVFDTGEPLTRELSGLGPHGSEAWYSNRIGAVKVGERIVAASIVARDITQQTRIEEEMRRRQADLAHVSRLNTMGEMAATLAHELNQPLSAISNYAAGCARRLQTGPVDTDQLIEAAQTIGRQASNASETIGRILDFVRKKEVRYQRAGLNELVTNAIELAAPEAKRHRVTISVEAADNLPPIMGDRIQIEQVLLNLLVNAIEALHESSGDRRHIVVTTSPASSQWVQISVCDNGCGLPDDFSNWIFEPFQSSKDHGIGMGLSISRSIIGLHKGQLWATPNDNGGATFHVSLPVSPGSSVSQETMDNANDC